MNPLLDSEFLVKLNNDKNRTIYAHIISLNQYEHPIEQLEGVVTAGSITIDGQSAVRRVCSLTLSAKNLNINNVYWGLTTKVKIEIGLQNNVNSKYDNIIWFPQGIFILTDFKTTQTINNYTINLTGKDKMCMLNGDVSGNLPAPVRFDSYTDASQQTCTIGNSGNYNNFLDNDAANAILEGFRERYGSDYQYIQGVRKILTLQFIPVNNNINGKIQFGLNDKEIELKSLLIQTKEKLNGKNIYEINLNDKDIFGFIVKECQPGDQFIWTIEQKIPITIIIQEMLHQFGQERYSNIIIKDIEPYALEMLDNAFKKNYYLLHDGTIYRDFVSQDNLINNYKLYGQTNADGTNTITLDEENNINNLIFRNYVEEDDISLIDILSGSTLEKENREPTKIVYNNNPSVQYTVQPVYDNEVAGYGMTLLVYPDDLIGQPGDSITSILDKIVNMLGDYEYFYDLNGQFIFQAKPAYVKTAWNGTIFLTDENYIEASELADKVAYTFDDSTLTTQYQNTPNMNNIKNDYIIWGEKKNLSGNSIKFHGRYAIENIPLEYTDFNGYTWTSNKTNSLIKAIYEKKESAIKSYQHIYDYPSGYTPEEGGWWEINDWANYYQSIFGVDLSKNSSFMNKYHVEYTDQEETNGIINMNNYFLSNYDYPISKMTDVITLVYSDIEKTNITYAYSHTSCTHYYSEFMDLRLLNDGWEYETIVDDRNKRYKIINIWDSTKKYLLENKKIINEGYHPDYTTSFIYKPILPNDKSIYASDIILNLIYTDAKNKNGQYRQYALQEDVDWRHLIHIMADDWYQHHTEDDYEIKLRSNNNWPDLNIDLYPYGKTGYEQFYLDFTSMGGFWQDLYDIYTLSVKYYDTHPELIVNSINNKINIDKYNMAKDILLERERNNYSIKYFTSGAYKYWNTDVIKNPENLNFWFDFYKADEMGIGKFAISVIGDRPKTINDSAIKTIIYRDTPDVIYCSYNEYLYYKERMVLKDGYKYIIVGNNDQSFEPEFLEQELITNPDDFYNNYGEILTDDVKTNFVRSIRGKTVHDQADDMLYQYSYYNDTVNINNVPVYSLQPNTIISTKDELSRVTGYYVVDKINISLAYNGMMQITAIKSPERIY